MRKSIAVGVLVAGLLAGAGTAMAQVAGQGGIADPLSLAASGVLIPYITELGTVATLQVASPVGPQLGTHMFFFDANCARVGDSVGMLLTTNDIAFQQISSAQGGPVPAGTNGLVTIAQADTSGFNLIPLDPAGPLHVRMYLFNAADGRSRVLEPIILDSAEFPGNPNTWSPLRTAATYYSPLQTATVQSILFLVCPRNSIQGAAVSAFPTNIPGSLAQFPAIAPTFPSIASPLRARIYDTNEVFKRDVQTSCDCFTQKAVTLISNFYSDPIEAAAGTYTELETNPVLGGGPFTGYTNIFTVGSPLNNFFGRLSGGSRDAIQGNLFLCPLGNCR